MITGKDVRVEAKTMMDILNSEEKTVSDKFKAIGQFLVVLSKIVLGNRRNLVKVMEKLEVEKDIPQNNEKKS